MFLGAFAFSWVVRSMIAVGNVAFQCGVCRVFANSWCLLRSTIVGGEAASFRFSCGVGSSVWWLGCVRIQFGYEEHDCCGECCVFMCRFWGFL